MQNSPEEMKQTSLWIHREQLNWPVLQEIDASVKE
jgi:hypothetical protein